MGEFCFGARKNECMAESPRFPEIGLFWSLKIASISRISQKTH